MLSHPWYAVIVIFHVLFAVVGFSALGATGAFARLARTSPDPYTNLVVQRFFRPGHNLAAYSIYLVPVFGGIALGYSGDAHKLYPYIGLGLWIAAIGLATGLMWPNERAIQRILMTGNRNDAALEGACRRCERAALVTTALFICALAVMVAQPA